MIAIRLYRCEIITSPVIRRLAGYRATPHIKRFRFVYFLLFGPHPIPQYRPKHERFVRPGPLRHPGHGGDAWAAGAGAPAHIDGTRLAPLWIVPFVGILLSIALFPLIRPDFWHAHFGKVAAFWALAFIGPYTIIYGLSSAVFELVHVLFLEYLPFVILLFTLYVIAGGVRVTGSLRGSPVVNTGILAFGTVIASWMGTTGAAMLLIRPLLAANHWRRHRVHVVVFFIILVANIGGSLTPLGDPPLFLGFLKGVDFFWPTIAMFKPMLICVAFLLPLFYLVDRFLYAREDMPPKNEGTSQEKLGLEGGGNLILLIGVVAAVLLSGLWRPGIVFEIYHTPVALQNLARDVILLGLAGLSWIITHIESRREAGFTWFPILEVAKLFAAIFITIIPAIAILRAGADGAFSPLLEMLSRDGQPVDAAYFWLTGILSSFLDNAPTYLVFFNAAGGDPETLMGPLASTLLAISAGAVFFGAASYIGNAPNFMVRSIAVEDGVPMPSFFSYMLWSVAILTLPFIIITWLYFI